MMYEGIRQGYSASPFVFSRYIDRLEAFIELELLAHLTAPEKRALKVTGILLHSLLFADDIVFPITQYLIAQHILDKLS